MKLRASRTSTAMERRTSRAVTGLKAIVHMVEIAADAADVRAGADGIVDAVGAADVLVVAAVIVDVAGRAGGDTRGYLANFHGLRVQVPNQARWPARNDAYRFRASLN